MPDHILEATNIKVRAKVSKGVANAADFTFKFLKDGTEIPNPPPATAAAEQGWVEATLTVPNVDDANESYILTYQVVHGTETKTDFPSFTVWPKAGSLTVKNAKDESKGLPGFRFKLKQGGRQMGEIRRVSNDDGTYNFDLRPGSAFSIDPVPPYKIPSGGWTTQTGRNRECKGDFDFEADFLAPVRGAIKQYVNFDMGTAGFFLGQDGIGPVVRIKVAVKGDADKPPDQKLGRAGMIINVRATFGPATGSGGVEKSSRVDASFKTEIKDELDLSGTAGPDANKIYTGKITLKADGTGEMMVYLGLAGGDTCKVEIGGSDRFLTDTTVNADATITFTNWRRLYYELLAPDFYAARELADRSDPVTGTTHKDYPRAALEKLKAIGDSCFIEYQFQAFHTFTKDNAPIGAAALTKKFLQIDTSTRPAFILTDYTMNVDPTGFAGWDNGKRDVTNYIKLCDQNYYWETRAGRKHYLDDATAQRHTIPVTAPYKGYFIPISGLKNGGGVYSVQVTDGGAEGFKWTAKVDPAACSTLVDPIAESRPAASMFATRRVVKIKETNQNLETQVEFTKDAGAEHVGTPVSESQKTALEQWLTDRFLASNLKNHGNRISITITGESGNTRRDDRFNAVKAIVTPKVNALKGTNTITAHPGLDSTGIARTGTLTKDSVNMTESDRTQIVLDLPHSNADEPGSFVGALSRTKCPITIECYIEAHNKALGLCEGKQVLACFSKANAAIDVCTTAHELGHSYGMAVFTATDKPPKGMTTPKKITEAETVDRYKTNGSNGQYYNEKNHSGSHCAFGFSDTQKGQPDYQQEDHSAALCIMFGAGGRDRIFCPLCADLIRGTNLTVLPVVKGS